MNLIIKEFEKSLRTGFMDSSDNSEVVYQPALITNQKTPPSKVYTTLISELITCDEFYISVAFVTTSGVAILINTLNELNKNGIRGQVLVSQYLNFTQPEALRRLLQFQNIDLRIATNVSSHTKGYIFKKKDYVNLIIGSSNLTANAISVNKEWNLKVSAMHQSGIAERILGEFDKDFAGGTIVNLEFISEYEKVYKQQQLSSPENVEISKEWEPLLDYTCPQQLM
jgi:HKD family nuclease